VTWHRPHSLKGGGVPPVGSHDTANDGAPGPPLATQVPGVTVWVAQFCGEHVGSEPQKDSVAAPPSGAHATESDEGENCWQ
jgi:hypothetical protein